MSEAVQHYLDKDHVFTGHEGLWTMCWKPWTVQPEGAVPCPECVTAAVEYADTMRRGQRRARPA